MPDGARLRFYSAETLGPSQSLTPEGFLLVQNVPLARTGTLLYAKGEVPVDADDSGIIRIQREAEDVFAPIAVASFAGKPVTNDHPPEKVSPANWKDYAVGVVMDPRRGDGKEFDNDYLYADLLIHDKDAIKDIRDGKREVSAGYDADYQQIRPGEGRQHLIVGNHCALVDKGRCGPRCAIGDEAMAVANTKNAWFDAIMRAHYSGDSQVLVDELEKIAEMLGKVWDGKKQPDSDMVASKDGVHVHLHSAKDDDEGEEGGGGGGKESEVLQRLEALERAVAIIAKGDDGDEGKSKDAKSKDSKTKDSKTKDEDEEEKEEDEDDKKKESKDAKTKDEDEEEKEEKEDKKESKDRASVGDSSSLRGAWQELISRAEFLTPGIKLPTFDSKAPARTTFDAMCNFRRKALLEGIKEDDVRTAVEQVGGKRPNLTQMTCDAITLLFNGASELVRQGNQTSTRRVGPVYTDERYTAANQSLTDTVRSINERNRTRYNLPA